MFLMARQFLLSPFALLLLKGRRKGSMQQGVTGQDGSSSRDKGPWGPTATLSHREEGLGEGKDPAALARVPSAGPPLADGAKWDWKCLQASGQAEGRVGIVEGESQRKPPGMESTHAFLDVVYLKCPAAMLPALPSSHTSLPLPAHCSAG